MTNTEKRWYRLINIALRIILHSPIHGVLSRTTLVLTFTGRKTGKRYLVPISYIPTDDSYTCFTSKAWSCWWKNLQAGVPVMVRVNGYTHSGLATASDNGCEETAHRLATFLHTFPTTAKRYGVRLNDIGQPNYQDVIDAARHPDTVMITIRC